jgi:hypothetical protein
MLVLLLLRATDADLHDTIPCPKAGAVGQLQRVLQQRAGRLAGCKGSICALKGRELTLEARISYPAATHKQAP